MSFLSLIVSVCLSISPFIFLFLSLSSSLSTPDLFCAPVTVTPISTIDTPRDAGAGGVCVACPPSTLCPLATATPLRADAAFVLRSLAPATNAVGSSGGSNSGGTDANATFSASLFAVELGARDANAPAVTNGPIVSPQAWRCFVSNEYCEIMHTRTRTHAQETLFSSRLLNTKSAISYHIYFPLDDALARPRRR